MMSDQFGILPLLDSMIKLADDFDSNDNNALCSTINSHNTNNIQDEIKLMSSILGRIHEISKQSKTSSIIFHAKNNGNVYEKIVLLFAILSVFAMIHPISQIGWIIYDKSLDAVTWQDWTIHSSNLILILLISITLFLIRNHIIRYTKSANEYARTWDPIYQTLEFAHTSRTLIQELFNLAPATWDKAKLKKSRLIARILLTRYTDPNYASSISDTSACIDAILDATIKPRLIRYIAKYNQSYRDMAIATVSSAFDGNGTYPDDNSRSICTKQLETDRIDIFAMIRKLCESPLILTNSIRISNATFRPGKVRDNFFAPSSSAGHTPRNVDLHRQFYRLHQPYDWMEYGSSIELINTIRKIVFTAAMIWITRTFALELYASNDTIKVMSTVTKTLVMSAGMILIYAFSDQFILSMKIRLKNQNNDIEDAWNILAANEEMYIDDNKSKTAYAKLVESRSYFPDRIFFAKPTNTATDNTTINMIIRIVLATVAIIVILKSIRIGTFRHLFVQMYGKSANKICDGMDISKMNDIVNRDTNQLTFAASVIALILAVIFAISSTSN